jgi:hypothetical protein
MDNHGVSPPAREPPDTPHPRPSRRDAGQPGRGATAPQCQAATCPRSGPGGRRWPENGASLFSAAPYHRARFGFTRHAASLAVPSSWTRERRRRARHPRRRRTTIKAELVDRGDRSGFRATADTTGAPGTRRGRRGRPHPARAAPDAPVVGAGVVVPGLVDRVEASRRTAPTSGGATSSSSGHSAPVAAAGSVASDVASGGVAEQARRGSAQRTGFVPIGTGIAASIVSGAPGDRAPRRPRRSGTWPSDRSPVRVRP